MTIGNYFHAARYPYPDSPTQFLSAESQQTPQELPNAEPVEVALHDREAVRLIVIGSKLGIETIIQTLHHRNFAQVGEWSPLLPHESGKFMRILTRYIVS